MGSQVHRAYSSHMCPRYPRLASRGPSSRNIRQRVRRLEVDPAGLEVRPGPDQQEGRQPAGRGDGRGGEQHRQADGQVLNVRGSAEGPRSREVSAPTSRPSARPRLAGSDQEAISFIPTWVDAREGHPGEDSQHQRLGQAGARMRRSGRCTSRPGTRSWRRGVAVGTRSARFSRRRYVAAPTTKPDLHAGCQQHRAGGAEVEVPLHARGRRLTPRTSRTALPPGPRRSARVGSRARLGIRPQPQSRAGRIRAGRPRRARSGRRRCRGRCSAAPPRRRPRGRSRPSAERLLAAPAAARGTTRAGPRSGPEMVPEANRSPVRSEAPLTVMWASIWAGDQYIEAYGGRLTTSPLSSTSTSMSRPRAAGPLQVGERRPGPGRAGRPRRRRAPSSGRDPVGDRGGERLAEERARAGRTPRPGCRAPTSR